VIYQRIYRYGRWMGLGQSRSETLYEFEVKLKNALQVLADSPRREKSLNAGLYEIGLLTDYSVLANYSQDPIRSDQKKEILLYWRNLRMRLQEAVWTSFWKTVKDRLLPRQHPESDHSIVNGAADE
jgi:hypothetical protein